MTSLKSLGLCITLTLLGFISPDQALAAFPDKPIKIIIGFPAGGPLDAHIRLLSDRLQSVLGQSIVIDYKVGAGGSVGAQFVAQSPADGYTLLLANTGTMVINPAVYSQLPYNTLKDFQAVARTAQQPLALIVNNDVPAKTLKEFIDYAKRNPGKINYGSAGNGGISHLVPEMLKEETKIFMVHIPYRGSAPALPDVPTVMETGVAKFEVVGFYGILAPKNTPPDIVQKLSNAFKQTLESKEIQQRMISQGADPAYLSAEEFTIFLKKEMPRWANVVKQAGAKID
jgi:tripartite-type tricarboxylate transporter receptor subunit TctC